MTGELSKEDTPIDLYATSDDKTTWRMTDREFSAVASGLCNESVFYALSGISGCIHCRADNVAAHGVGIVLFPLPASRC